jgi:signal transduction histidine kinase
MSEIINLLVIEDCADDLELLLRELKRNDFSPQYACVQSAEGLQPLLQGRDWDVIISDYKMPAFDARAALELVKASGRDIPFVVVSGTIGEALAVELMRAGASDYIMKNNLQRLAEVVRREIREAHSRSEQRHMEISLRQMEERLAQSQKLESIGRLAGGIAHDFNNMLSVILGYAEMMQFQLPEGSPQRQSVDQILEAAQRSRDLTRQLLAFARKQTLEMRRLELNEIVRDIEKLLRRTLRENIDLKLELAAGLGYFSGDLRQMEQVLLNLAVNGQDAMPEGGTLLVETSNVVLNRALEEAEPGTETGAFVRLRVRDTGNGMDEGTRARIFEPFFTTKELGRGTGLGLSTVYGIVMQHEGHIKVISSPGEGTQFLIYFPRQDGLPVFPASAAERTALSTGAETILVAEDQEQVRILTAEILRRQGYRVLEASDGKSALAAAAGYPDSIHLLVSDVVMPDTNSWELYARLKLSRPNLKLLHMSGYAEETAMPNEELYGHFIQKPFLFREFVRKVREVLDSN